MIINKVYHLLDLHIRNLQRHKEYKLIFNKFLKQVKQDNIEDSLIYIGDIEPCLKLRCHPNSYKKSVGFLPSVQT